MEPRRGDLSHEAGVGGLVLAGQKPGEEGSSDPSKSQKEAAKSGVGMKRGRTESLTGHRDRPGRGALG